MSKEAVLEEAARIIEGGWARHELAYDAEGNPVYYTDPTAVTFCLVGALSLAEIRLNHSFGWNLLLKGVLEKRGFTGIFISDWNNEIATSAAEVAEVLREAKQYV
jgi:YD repeat-containing protein